MWARRSAARRRDPQFLPPINRGPTIHRGPDDPQRRRGQRRTAPGASPTWSEYRPRNPLGGRCPAHRSRPGRGNARATRGRWAAGRDSGLRPLVCRLCELLWARAGWETPGSRVLLARGPPGRQPLPACSPGPRMAGLPRVAALPTRPGGSIRPPSSGHRRTAGHCPGAIPARQTCSCGRSRHPTNVGTQRPAPTATSVTARWRCAHRPGESMRSSDRDTLGQNGAS